EGPAVLTVIAQVTVADIAATLAIPLVLRPGHAASVAGGSALIVCCVLAMLGLERVLRGVPFVHSLRREGKRRRWAIDLRVALIVAIAAATTIVPLLAARLTHQPAASGLLASAQLGVPSAIVALGLSEHVISSALGAAIITAAMFSLAVSSAGAALMAPTA